MSPRSDRSPVDRSRRARRAAAAVLAAATSLVGLSVAGAQTAPPALALNPSTGLLPNQSIQLSVSGFTGFGTRFLQFYQCPPGATQSLSCVRMVASLFLNNTDSSGTTSAAVSFGALTAGDGTPFTCDQTHDCVVLVEQDQPRQSATAPLAWAGEASTTTTTTRRTRPTVPPGTWPPGPPALPGTCPIPGGNLLRLSGSATAQEAMRRWAKIVCQPSTLDVPLDYAYADSHTGRHNLLDPSTQVSVAVSDTPWLAGDQADLEAAGMKPEDFVFVPMLASSLEITGRVSLAEYSLKQYLRTLFLSPESATKLLANNLNGGSNAFGDPSMAADNAGNPALDYLVVPSVFYKSVARAEHNADTWLFTSWLYRDPAARTAWEAKLGPGAPTGPTEYFPPTHARTLTGAYDTEQESRSYPAGTQPQWSSFALSSSPLAWLDDDEVFASVVNQVTYVHPAQKVHASLRNPDGAFVEPTPDAVTRGLAQMKESADGTYRPVFTKADGWNDPGGYVLPVVSYAVLPRHLAYDTTPEATEVRTWAQSFLGWAVTEGQKPANLPTGYVPLPPRMVERARRQLADWRASAPPGGGSAPPATTAPAEIPTDPGDVTDIAGDGYAGDTFGNADAFDDPAADLASTFQGGAGAGEPGGPGTGGDSPLEHIADAVDPRRILAALLAVGALSPFALGVAGSGLAVGGPALRLWHARRSSHR